MQLREICIYINDKLNGDYKEYNEFGDLIKSYKYENDIKIEYTFF